MIAKVDILEMENLMEINDITNSDLSVEADLCIKTIDRILSEGTATLKSIIKISYYKILSFRNLARKHK